MSNHEPRPHAEARAIALEFIDALKGAYERIDLAGSLRRRRREIRDIELVAIPKFERRTQKAEKVPDLFGQGGGTGEIELDVNLLWERVDTLTKFYSKHGDRYRQFPYAGMTIDLFTADKDNWGNIHLIRTGSAEFSRWMMTELNRRGYTSHEGRIHRRAGVVTGLVQSAETSKAVGPSIKTPDEYEIFRLAGHMYLEPHEREIAPGVRRAR